MIEYQEVELTTASSKLTFPVKPTHKDKFWLRQVSGLAPMPIQVNTSPTVNPGAVYGGTQIQEREIVVTFRLNPDYETNETFSLLRNKLYSTLSGGRGNYVTVTLVQDSTRVGITGYVSGVESSIYTRTPEVQITIKCPDPFFLDEAPINMVANERKVDFDGSIWYQYWYKFDNSGAAPTGIKVQAVLKSHASTIFDFETEFGGRLSVQGPPQAKFEEAIIDINTTPNARNIKSGKDGYLLGFMRPDSVWPMLSSAEETISFWTPTQAHGVQFDVRKQYWGF